MRKRLSAVPPAYAITVLAVLVFGAWPSSEPPLSYRMGRVYFAILLFAGIFSLGYLRYRIELVNSIQYIWEQPINKVVLVWLCTSFISDVFAEYPELAFSGSIWWGMGFSQLVLLCLFFFLGQLTVLNQQSWRWLSLGLAILTALTFLEALGYRPLLWVAESYIYPSVTVGQRGHLAGLFAVASGVAAYRRAYPSFLLAGLGIALCNNTAAVLAYGVTVAVLIALDRGRLWQPAIGSLAVTLLLFFNVGAVIQHFCSCDTQRYAKPVASNMRAATGRWSLWKSAVAVAVQRPLLGWGDEQYSQQWHRFIPRAEADKMTRELVGLSSTTVLMGDYPAVEYQSDGGSLQSGRLDELRPHNAVLEELTSHGITGVGLLSALIYLLILSNRRLSLPLLSYGVYLLAWFTLFSVTPMFMLLLGTLYNSARVNNTDSPTRFPPRNLKSTLEADVYESGL